MALSSDNDNKNCWSSRKQSLQPSISCFCTDQDLEQSLGLHQAALNLGHELLRPPHSLLLSLEDNFHWALWKYFTGNSRKKCVTEVKPYSGHVADYHGELG